MNRGVIARAFARALRELDPGARVAAALPRSLRSPRSRVPVRIVALGKASPAMAAGALARLGEAVEHCLVVSPDGADVTALHEAAERAGIAARVQVMHAAHPLPDARSVRAGDACLAMATQADARVEIIVLVSGGASALACAPSPGITLRTKQAITRVMLESGASIQDINVVRKHISRLKGGGLLRVAASRSVLTIVASDVIGGAAGDVGSGPSVPDASTLSEARRLLKRFAPAFAEVPLVRTLAPTHAMARRARAKIVISPEDLARAMAALLREAGTPGTAVRLLPPSQASVEALAAEYVALAERARKPQIFVRAAEPSVTVTTSGGRGGRSTHLAARVGQLLGERRLDDSNRLLFAALASDGVDGGSETGGAIIDGLFAERVASRLGDAALDRSLERFDTGTLHRALGTAVRGGSTGHNLADLHVLVVPGRTRLAHSGA